MGLERGMCSDRDESEVRSYLLLSDCELAGNGSHLGGEGGAAFEGRKLGFIHTKLHTDEQFIRQDHVVESADCSPVGDPIPAEGVS